LIAERFERIKHATIVEEIVGQIKKMMENSHLKPGDKLPPERDLAEMFGVGRSSIREALQALQAMGIVGRKQGTGSYLTDGATQALNWFNTRLIVEKFTIKELAQARKLIEVQIAAHAAEIATRKNIAAMELAHARFVKFSASNLSEKTIFLDYAFHKTVAEGTQNRFVLEMLDMLRDILISANFSVLTQEKVLRAISYHERILGAIKAHNPEAAKQAMTEHLSNFEEYMIQHYEKTKEGKV
jgi:GntR family transcriptional repressor for pyruvate dehydrogenase complex